MDGQQVGMFSLYFGTGSFTDPKGLLGADWSYTAAQFGFDGTQVYYRNGGTGQHAGAFVAGAYYDFKATVDFDTNK